MAVEAVRRDADLGEVEFGAAIQRLQLERCDRIMIGPPILGAPGLHDLASRLQHEIETGDMISPRRERAADRAADARLFA
jgi:hypothetical protein